MLPAIGGDRPLLLLVASAALLAYVVYSPRAGASGSGIACLLRQGAACSPPPPPPASAADARCPPPQTAYDARLTCEDGSLPPARAAVRNSTRGCGAVFFDTLLAAPPLRECGAAELSAAISASWRAALDAPLVVPGCRLEWFTGARACELLQAVGGLGLHGDALARHLAQTLREAATGDLGRGTTAHMDAEGVATCACEGAYDDGHIRRFPGDEHAPLNKLCRTQSLALLPLAGVRAAWPDYCPGWPPAMDLLTYDDGAAPPPQQQQAPAVALLQGGLHQPQLDAAAVEAVFGSAGAAAAGDAARRPRRLIFSLLHAPGPIKAAEYLHYFGMQPTLAFNELVRGAAARVGALVFDPFAPTLNATSIDGVHYWHATNVQLAQLLLNLVHRMRLEDAAADAALAAGQ